MRKPLSGADVARRVCLSQVAIAIGAAALLAVWWGRAQALPALYGGAIALLPTLYFARRVFAQREGAAPEDVVGAMFRGEMGKFALTAVMFALGVKFFAAQFPALLIAYTACLMAYWLVMARVGFGGGDKE